MYILCMTVLTLACTYTCKLKYSCIPVRTQKCRAKLQLDLDNPRAKLQLDPDNPIFVYLYICHMYVYIIYGSYIHIQECTEPVYSLISTRLLHEMETMTQTKTILFLRPRAKVSFVTMRIQINRNVNMYVHVHSKCIIHANTWHMYKF
jgi:hypothetical protein